MLNAAPRPSAARPRRRTRDGAIPRGFLRLTREGTTVEGNLENGAALAGPTPARRAAPKGHRSRFVERRARDRKQARTSLQRRVRQPMAREQFAIDVISLPRRSRQRRVAIAALVVGLSALLHIAVVALGIFSGANGKTGPIEQTVRIQVAPPPPTPPPDPA